MTHANTLLEQFRQNRDERPEEPAFLIAAGDRSVPISWREFAEDIEEIAWIVHHYAPGAVVGLLGENSYEWITAHAAGLFAGVTVVPLEVNLSAKEIVDRLAFTGATYLVHSALYVEKAREVERLLPGLVVGGFGSHKADELMSIARAALDMGDDSVFDLPERDEDETAMIVFTSGTTSKPRGAELTLRGIRTFSEFAQTAFGFQPGSRSLVWHPDKSWPNQKFGASDGIALTAVVTAWATNDPPMYLAADLVSGGVKYYTCAEAVPGGVQDILYKTTSVLMRRIYARGKTFVMGSPSDEPGHFVSSASDHREDQHEVTFDNDYYIGVYEVTQRQWWLVTGGHKPSWHTNATCWAERPVENVSHAMVRHNKYDTNARNPDLYYPAAPYGQSFLGLLRTRSGGLAFDLPSAAQWEYACKAGNGDFKWGDGTPIDGNLQGVSGVDDEDPAFNEIGRNAYNNATKQYSADSSASATSNANADRTCGTDIVGNYRPNSWGLYDMHGNVYEFCNDPFGNDGTSNIVFANTYGGVPVSASGKYRVRKGGSFQRGPFRHRAAFQLSVDATAVNQDTGVRLAITLE